MALPLTSQGQESPTPVRTLGTVTITGGQPTSLPTQIPTTIEGITREQIEHRSTPPTAKTRSSTCPACWCASATSATTTTPCCPPAPRAPATARVRWCTPTASCCPTTWATAPTFAPRWGMVTPEEIERVDVLYGPFSAAYPGNSVGAVVDYVTRMPRQFEAHGKLGYGVPAVRASTPPTALSRPGRPASRLGNRNGDWSWFFNVNRSDSDGQPQTFATRVVATGAPGAAGTPVTGAVAGLESHQSGLVAAGHRNAVRHAAGPPEGQARLRHHAGPARQLHLGLVGQRLAGQRALPICAMRPAIPCTAAASTSTGRSFTLLPSDFAPTRESLTHFMHGLSLKSHGRGEWDWELAASSYDYHRDTLRARRPPRCPRRPAGGAGRIVDMKGTGWTTLAAKGIWRPLGRTAPTSWTSGCSATPTSCAASRTPPPTGSPARRARATWPSSATPCCTACTRRTPGASRRDGRRCWARGWSTGRRPTARPRTPPPPSRIRSAARPTCRPRRRWRTRRAEQWVLKASTGRAVRMPTVSELYQGGVNASGTLINNDPNLKPEDSWTTELTAERDARATALLRLTAFFERTQGRAVLADQCDR